MEIHLKTLIIFCVIHSKVVESVEGKEHSFTQPIGYPVSPISYAVNFGHIVSPYNSSSEKNVTLHRVGVKLPDVPCSESNDCSNYDDSFLICVEKECTCMHPYCWVYHYEVSTWSSKNIFECGKCGQLGSWCNETVQCEPPGECLSDGYCHCPVGENYGGVCVVVDDSWAYKITLTGFGILFFFAFLVIFVHLYRNRSWDRPGPWCCHLCKSFGGSREQHGSCEKTPAYTIQNHYSSQLSNLEVQLSSAEVPVEASNQHSQTQANNERTTCGSTTSAETEVTEISEINISIVGHPYTDSSEDSSVSNDTPQNSRLITAMERRDPSPSTSDDSSTTSLVSSCTHQRCHLCLPKPVSGHQDTPLNRGSLEYSETTESGEHNPVVTLHIDRDSVSLEYYSIHL